MLSYIFEPHYNAVMNGVDVIYTLKHSFSASSLLTFWVGYFSTVGVVLCTVGCLAASLASTDQKSIVSPKL